ncbi:MAG: HNH endonuclease [Bdellovibrionales bacterium]|nr:HNH endonuclease [Bdellovibrionales bacterium]
MGAVLLLNASFEPLKVISWQRAVCLLFLDKIEILEEYDHEIRSVSIAIKAPAVVRLLSYVKAGSRVPPFSRFNIFARDGFQCQYCRKMLTSKEATLDHVLPRSHGGKTSWDNVVCCCRACNIKKGSRTPEQAKMKLLKKPVRPGWLPVLQLRLNGKYHPSWEIFLETYSKST